MSRKSIPAAAAVRKLPQYKVGLVQHQRSLIYVDDDNVTSIVHMLCFYFCVYVSVSESWIINIFLGKHFRSRNFHNAFLLNHFLRLCLCKFSVKWRRKKMHVRHFLFHLGWGKIIKIMRFFPSGFGWIYVWAQNRDA